MLEYIGNTYPTGFYFDIEYEKSVFIQANPFWK